MPCFTKPDTVCYMYKMIRLQRKKIRLSGALSGSILQEFEI
jgi:hypothetical protein